MVKCGVAGCTRLANMISQCAVCHCPLCTEHIANRETVRAGDEIACPVHVAEVEKRNAAFHELLRVKIGL